MRIKPNLIIKTLKQNNLKVGATAKLLGIHRTTVYRWTIKASNGRGYLVHQGLKRASTAPKTIHYKLTSSERINSINLRSKTHLGAKKIKYLLRGDASAMTFHRLFKDKKLVTKQVQYRRPHFQNGKAMRPSNTQGLGYLQMDTKHVTPELSGLPVTVYEYAAIDIVSRYKLAVILPEINDENASLALEFFLKWFPFPIKYIQTDNGLEFQRAFEQACQKHQITHYYIHKNSPNENAVIERSFRTDQDEFFYWLEEAPEHMGQLNQWLQEFLNKYNTWRPHQALEYKTPLEIVKMLQMS